MNVAILGLGRFGTQLALELVRLGVDVLAVDRGSENVNELTESVLLAAEGDVTDVEFLESLGLENYDVVVVAIGAEIATSVLVTLTLKKRLNLRNVAAKASTADHTRALELAGADTVVNPEREAAVRLAHTLGSRGVRDYMALRGDYGIARVAPPATAHGSEIGRLDIEKRFKVVLLARLRDDGVSFYPDVTETVMARDIWIVAGHDADIAALQR